MDTFESKQDGKRMPVYAPCQDTSGIGRVWVVVLLFFLGGAVTNAQNDTLPRTTFTKMYLPIWKEATAHCLDVAMAMPDSLYTYRPAPESKSFAEQMIHIASASALLTKRYVQGFEVRPHTPNADDLDKQAIIALLKTSFAYTETVVRTIDQETLDQKCTMFHSGNTVSRAFALFYVQDHLTNHRAKANLYLRMNGIAPPEYTW